VWPYQNPAKIDSIKFGHVPLRVEYLTWPNSLSMLLLTIALMSISFSRFSLYFLLFILVTSSTRKLFNLLKINPKEVNKFQSCLFWTITGESSFVYLHDDEEIMPHMHRRKPSINYSFVPQILQTLSFLHLIRWIN